MNCEQARDILSEYIDGELAPELRRDLEQHVAECARCRAALDTLRRTAEAVRDLPKVPAPRGLSKTILTTIGATAPAVRARTRRWMLAANAVAFAACALLAVAIALQLRPRSPAAVRPSLAYDLEASETARRRHGSEERPKKDEAHLLKSRKPGEGSAKLKLGGSAETLAPAAGTSLSPAEHLQARPAAGLPEHEATQRELLGETVAIVYFADDLAQAAHRLTEAAAELNVKIVPPHVKAVEKETRELRLVLSADRAATERLLERLDTTKGLSRAPAGAALAQGARDGDEVALYDDRGQSQRPSPERPRARLLVILRQAARSEKTNDRAAPAP